MVEVKKGDKTYPFSKGILARSISSLGMTVEEAYEIVENIKDRIEKEGFEEISSSEIKDMVSKELKHRNRNLEERYYRVRRKIKYLDQPLFIMIGGGPGVGKSSLSAEIGHRLGINRVIGTDTIREIMRSIISPELIPTLHQSTFTACDKLRTPFVSNKLIYAFEQQVSLVSEGLVAVMNRGRKEGLNMVLNGVHIVPGFIQTDRKSSAHTYQYVLDVPDIEQHIQHFHSREEGSLRDPSRYIDRLDRIREIHDYVVSMALKGGITVVENVDFEKTLKVILEDVFSGLEEVMEDEP